MVYPKPSCYSAVGCEGGRIVGLSSLISIFFPSILLCFTRNSILWGSLCLLTFIGVWNGKLESMMGMGDGGETRIFLLHSASAVSLVVLGSSEAPAPNHSPSVMTAAVTVKQPRFLDTGTATCCYCPCSTRMTTASCC